MGLREVVTGRASLRVGDALYPPGKAVPAGVIPERAVGHLVRRGKIVRVDEERLAEAGIPLAEPTGSEVDESGLSIEPGFSAEEYHALDVAGVEDLLLSGALSPEQAKVLESQRKQPRRGVERAIGKARRYLELADSLDGLTAKELSTSVRTGDLDVRLDDLTEFEQLRPKGSRVTVTEAIRARREAMKTERED